MRKPKPNISGRRQSVLTVQQIIAIREERANGGWGLREIAARHGVAHSTVSRICLGVIYPDLPGPITRRMRRVRYACWRGHPLEQNRRKGQRWQDCKACHTIRNREYQRRKKAQAS